jgi:hypothetical protein
MFNQFLIVYFIKNPQGSTPAAVLDLKDPKNAYLAVRNMQLICEYAARAAQKLA